MKRLLIAALAVVCLVASAEAGKRYILRIPAVEIPVELEEIVPPPPVPPADPAPTNPPPPALTIRDGHFYEGDRLFRDVSTTLAGDAVLQPDAMLERMLNRIDATGCRLIRTLHVALDDKQEEPVNGVMTKVSQYQPTMSEWRNGLPFVDRLVAQLKQRKMYLWLTAHHRQRLTLAEATALGVEKMTHGKRFGGEYPGEIAELFLVMPELEEYVTKYVVELALRYKDEPTVAVLEIANEKVRFKGYHVSDRNRTDDSFKQYREAWFRSLDRYQAEFGVTDATMRKADYARFHAWLAHGVYARMYKALRDAGIRIPIFASSGLGDCRMDVLPILAAGDGISWHAYGFVGDTLPDPFVSNDVRDIESIARAIRCQGFPVVMSEYSDVHEGKKLKLTKYLQAPRIVAAAGFDLSMHYAAWLGWIGSGAAGELYNGFETPGFEADLKAARAEFVTSLPTPHTWHQLTEEEVFGRRFQRLNPTTGKPEWIEELPAIVGTEKYGDATGNILPPLKWLTKQPAKTTLAF